MIKSFVMAGVILGAASSLAVAGSATTYGQYGNPSYGTVNPNGSVDAYDQNGNPSYGRVSPNGSVNKRKRWRVYVRSQTLRTAIDGADFLQSFCFQQQAYRSIILSRAA
jgi:hypothetical protein